MEGITCPVSSNPVTIEDSLSNENWPRFSKISNGNFSLTSPLVPCILSNVNVKPMGVIKPFCDHPNLIWEHVKNIFSHPLSSIIKGPEYAVTRNFTSSVQASMDFRHYLSPYCFSDQVVKSCMGLILDGPWFAFAHTEIWGGASSALLNKGIKTWCASTSSTGTRFFGRWCHSPEGFRFNAARSTWTWGTLFTVYSSTYRRFDLYSPCSRSRRFNFGHWFTNDFIRMGRRYYYNQQIIIQILDEYTLGVCRGKWREIFRKKGLSASREWVFFPSTGPLESMDRLQKYWNYWEEHSFNLLSSLHVEKEVPRKIKCNPPTRTVIWIPLDA